MYKCINVSIYDPNNSIFKSSKNDHARASFLYCCNAENCEAYKNGCCFLRNGLYGHACPYGKSEKEEGYTSRAKNFYHKISDWKNRYPGIGNTLSPCKDICRIGDYIYLPLHYLHNYENPIDADLGIKSEHLLPIENFTAEIIKRLFCYRPRAMFGGEIAKYQNEELPRFAVSLYNKYGNLFTEVENIFPDIKKYVDSVNYIGKDAKLKTLSPGKVKSGSHIYDWDGKILHADENILLVFGAGTGNIVSIEPSDDFTVTVADNSTVNSDTVFK